MTVRSAGQAYCPPTHLAPPPRSLQRGSMRAAVAVIVWIAAPASAEPLAGVASVIDGDTIEIHGQRIRLEGIDAPESAQLCAEADGKQWRCGQRAALALADHLRNRTVACEPTGRDRYKRTLAVCRIGGGNVNEWLVRQGWALAYRRYSIAYVPAEEAARAAGAGIWTGEFVPPWEWRRRPQRSEGASVE